ncbi:MAG: CBS domain-containing protein [Myxococcales bacterium]|nr:CBS domain-containing protein [Myxococcales bacterium]
MSKLAMMHVVRVKDVMSSPVSPIESTATLTEAEQLLASKRISGAPVVGAQGKLLGMLSLSDLAGLSSWQKDEMSVLDRATKVLFGVRAEDPAIAAARLMVSERIHRALVVGADGTIVGIITPMDLLRAVVEGRSLTDGETERVDFTSV